MLSKLAVAAFVLQAAVALAGQAIIENRCNYDVWLWSVAKAHSSGALKLRARWSYREPTRSVCNGCGTSFKISRTNQLVAGKHTQFEYTKKNGRMWYDISLVDCAKGKSASNCPRHDGGLKMSASADGCTTAECAAGSYCPRQSYYVHLPKLKVPMDDPVYNCPAKAGVGMDIVGVLCSSEKPLKRSVAGRLEIEE